MEDMFTPMYGNVYTVFDFILMSFGNIGSLFQGLLGSLGGLIGGLLP